MKILKLFGLTLGTLLALLIVLVGSLWAMADKGQTVPKTVEHDPRLPTITINDVRLHAQSVGDLKNPTIIVLHGGPGGDHQSLLELAQMSDDYHVFFYDQRGAGLSQRVPESELTIEHYVQELNAIVDLQLEQNPQGGKVLLVGHSWGGILGAAYLGQYAHKVAGAVLIEPGYLSAAGRAAWAERSADEMSSFAFFKHSMLTGFEAAHINEPDEDASKDYLIGSMAHAFANGPTNPYHCPDQSYDAPYWRFGAVANEAASKFSDVSLDAIAQNLAGVSVPVLLLAGECNTWIGAPLQEQHLQLFEEARMGVIAGVGHEVIWEDPDAALAEIRSFFAGL